jgi:putative acetyltransferase
MDIHIRPMQIADYASMREIWSSSDGVGLSEADTESGVARFLAANPGLSSVAVAEGRIVGGALCGHDGRRGYIEHLAVVPEFRGRGAGGAIVSACLRGLSREGIPYCHILVFADNEKGAAFWQRRGWRARPELRVLSIRPAER